MALWFDAYFGKRPYTYDQINQKLTQIIKADPNIDLTQYEQTFAIKILSVTRATKPPSGGGDIYI